MIANILSDIAIVLSLRKKKKKPRRERGKNSVNVRFFARDYVIIHGRLINTTTRQGGAKIRVIKRIVITSLAACLLLLDGNYATSEALTLFRLSPLTVGMPLRCDLRLSGTPSKTRLSGEVCTLCKPFIFVRRSLSLSYYCNTLARMLLEQRDEK